jgi:hypothetical protein
MTHMARIVGSGPTGWIIERKITMAVYVDDGFCGPRNSWGKWTGGGHLQADTEQELHDFANRLGLKREWFQEGSRPLAMHYDLTASKRAKAIGLGAVQETWRQAAKRRIAARKTS